MAEFDGRWLASVFAADTNFQVGPRFASAFGRHSDQLPDAFAIQRRKWILLQNPFCQIRGQHFVHVVAREAERGLREVVRAE